MDKKKKLQKDQEKSAKKKSGTVKNGLSEKSKKPPVKASVKDKKEKEKQPAASLPASGGKQADTVQPSSEKKQKEKRPLAFRISIKAAKILFIWIPLLLITVIIIALITAQFYLTAPRVEKLVTDNFNSMSEGTLSLKVSEFRPYTGFVIKDILVRNGSEFNNSKLFEMEKLVFRYGFFPMFAGNIRFPEIGFYKPRLYLEQKGGAWSAEKLMKPGKEKPVEEKIIEEKKEEPADTGEPSEEISLPISVEFLLKFILDDLRVYVKGEDFRTSMEGLTFTADIDVPPFSKIPKSLDAVSLLKKMNIVLNPREELAVSFYSSDAEVSPEIILTWRLAFSNKDRSTPAFDSSFRFGTYKLPVRLKKTYLAPLRFMVSYDMRYEPRDDRLDLNHFRVRFRKSTWLNLAGTVTHASAEQRVNIRMTKSSILLSELYPYYLKLTGDRRTRFSGTLSLYPLAITGTPDNLNINGAFTARNIYFKNPAAEASIPGLTFAYGVMKSGDDMKITSRIFMPHLYYTLEGSKSGDNGLELTADLLAKNSFGSVILNSIGFRFYSPEIHKNALSMNLSGMVNLRNSISGKIRINRFSFLKEPLAAMVPERFRWQVSDIPLEKPLTMDMDLNFKLLETRTAAVLGMLIKVPDYGFNDLRLNLDVVQDARRDRVNLNSFSITSKEWNLAVTAGGMVEMKKTPLSDSDLKLSVRLNNPVMKSVAGPWQLAGLLDLRARVKGDLETGKAFGSLKISGFNIKNDEDMINVRDVNMDFPFEYAFASAYTGESLLTVRKSHLIDNDNFRDNPNFTIASIRAKHPARKISYEYLKDFSASMSFRENVFLISSLRAYVLDGSLYGRNILFNLADLKPENMEFNLIMDVTNVDIAKLDEPDPKKKTRDAELSLNANFSGRGLDFDRELNTKGYINIYKIGEGFANRLMKGLSEEKGKSKLGIMQPVVDNFVIPRGFNFTLDRGLVYTTVTVDRKVVSYLTGIKVRNNRIQFDRMPIQEYLRKVSKGE